MKSNRSFTYIALVALVAISLAVASPAAAQRRGAGQGGGECTGGVGALFNEIEIVALSGEEDYLLFMWEEEKLARDVYLTLAETWQLPIFANISRAEQKHMDLMFKLIETYGFADQIPDDIPGAFVDPDLGALFSQFVLDGNTSLIAALRVGATIEDKDLADLYYLIESLTDNKHIELVAYNLAKGSRNHLRAFVRALEAQGEIYTPTIYLDQATFDAILEAGMEQQIFFNADGEPVPACGGAIGGFGMRRGQIRRGGQGNGGGHGSNGTGSGECDGTGGGSGECDGGGPHGGTNGGNGSGNGS
jgi:hypothetical protein